MAERSIGCVLCVVFFLSFGVSGGLLFVGVGFFFFWGVLGFWEGVSYTFFVYLVFVVVFFFFGFFFCVFWT